MRKHMGVILVLLLTLAPWTSPAAQLAAQEPAASPPAAAPAAGEPPPYVADPQPPAAAAPAAGAPSASIAETVPPPASPIPEQQTTQRSGLKEWVQAHPRAKQSALRGALAGGLAGMLVAVKTGRSPLAGALIGAATGGLVGFLIGKNQDHIYAGRDEAVRLANYDPSQGYVMRVEQLSFEPANAKPGERATLSIRYLVIGPDPNEKITVNCFRGIKYQDNYILGDGPSSFEVPRGGGIITTTSQITIPKDAPAGTYAVEATFDDPGGRFQQSKSSPLYIAS
jgi:Glycine zipper